MSGAPAVTVLIPTHNRSDVLPFAIRSVLAQTFGDFELLVVGDGCTDDTADVVASIDDPRVRWLDFPKAPGFGYANRNRALREGRGELVAYLAHDDLWLPDHLELLTALIDERGRELACSRTLLVSREGAIRQHLANLDDPAVVARFLRGREAFGPSCTVHRRSSLERHGYWREDLHHAGDWELFARIVRGDGGRLAYLGEPTFLHFVADWRRASRGRSAIDALRRWEGSQAPGTTVTVPPGTSEQEEFWNAISADPAGWTDALRRSLRVDADRLARMEYPSALAMLAYGQWQRFVGRRPKDVTARPDPHLRGRR